MKKINLLLLVLIISLLTIGCGFKIVDQSEINNKKFIELDFTGDDRINFQLKNGLKSLSKSNSSNLYRIAAKTTKIKEVKEKNIQNEITKYNIILKIDLKVININENNNVNYNFLREAELKVENKNSDTRKNEKKIIERLVDKILQDIINIL